MNKLRKSAAFLVTIAFLISALVPMSALAADPVSPTTAGEDAAERVDAAGSSVSARAAEVSTPAAREEVKAGVDVTDTSVTLTSSLASQGTVSANMLVNAPGFNISLDAGEFPDAPIDSETGEPYVGEWSVEWAGTKPSGEAIARAPQSGLRWTGIRSEDINEVGAWTYTCTATWSPAMPSMEPVVATFILNAKGVGLEKVGEYASRTVLPVNAETLDEGDEEGVVYVPFPLEVAVKEPVSGSPMEYPESAVDFGPTAVTVESFEWTCDRESLENWRVVTGREPSNTIRTEDLASGKSSILMEIDGANFTAGVSNYTCVASGVGVDSSGTQSFRAEVVPFLVAVAAGSPSEANIIDNDPTRIELKYQYQPSTTKPLQVEWRHEIAVEDATFVWKQDDGSANGHVVQDSSAGNPPRGPMIYMLPVQIQDGAQTYTCEVSSEHLDEVGVRDMHTEHVVSIFSNITPPSVIIQRVTKGTPTPIMGETLDTMGGVDLQFHAQVQGSGTASDVDLLTYEWQLVKADGSNGVLRDNRTADLFLENVNYADNNGDTYTVRVYNRSTGYTAEASITLLVEDAPQPPEVRMSSDPDNNGGKITRTEKKPIVMRAEVTNAVSKQALVFKWQQKTPDGNWEDAKGGSAKLDSTGMISEYTISSPTIAANNEMQYRCAVSTKVGTQESQQIYTRPEFTLEILPQTGLVSFTEPEEDQTLTIESGLGQDLRVKAETDQGQAPVYQWYVATGATSSSVGDHELGNSIPGATKDTYTTGRLAAGFYKFTCRATNKNDAELYADRVFKITVTQAPDQPIVEVVGDLQRGAMVGDTISFEVNAHTQTGAPVTYKWQRRTGGKGNWTDITGGARRMLTLRNVQTSDNGTELRCVVTNADVPTSYFESDIITLSVWRPEDVPQILEQPKSQRLLTGSQGAANATLEVVVATTGKDAYEFEWYYRPNDEADWQLTELQWEEFAESDKARAVLSVPDSPSSVGEYYCVITNPGGNPTGAQAKSDIARVDIMERHVPLITSEPPTKQYVSVGNTAMLHVVADIEPEEPLIYTWQTSPDGGETWKNCTGAEGDGYNTSTFTTQTITSEMVGYALYFRCAVTGQDNGVVVYTRVTQVIPKEPSPELKPISATFLTVTVDPRTGERFLTGHTVGKLSDALTPVAIRNALDTSDVKDGVVEITKDGRELKDTDPVGTGCVVTLLDSKGVPLDDITVVVMGDILGTGESSLSQVVKLAEVVKGKSKLAGAYAKASDHNKNEKIGEVSDLVAQAKIFRGAGGEAPPAPTDDPQASASPGASASASARPSASASASSSASASASPSASATRSR